MSKAFVLIETKRDESRKVKAVLSHVQGIVSAETVTPPYDIIAIVDGRSLNDINDMVNLRINSIAGVTRTVTCPAMQNSNDPSGYQQ